jgi:signal transduction histidine kinase/ActR/RegA family two-component response regulator
MSDPKPVGAYGEAALARAKDLPVRIAFALFIAAAAWVIVGDWGPGLWLAAVIAGQLIDAWIAAPLRRHPLLTPSRARILAYGGSIVINALIYSSLAAYLWFHGGDAGRAFAVLTPAGALLNNALQSNRGPRLLICACHALYTLGLPLLSAALHPADLLPMICVSLGGALYVVHVAFAVRRIEEGSTALREARDAADAERERAEQANAAKSDFLATISHEIRTPMNAVVASGALLQRTDLTPAQAEHVEMLANASEVLLGLLNDVLDISKIESGKLEVERAEFDLVRKLEASVQLWRAHVEPRGVTLSFDPTGLPQRIVTDPLRLQQIVFNLLSNAVKFTEAGSIVLRGGRMAGATGEVLWLEVADTGCGMDDATAARVFESFEQAGVATTRRHGGTGLGLSISRRLAELMGGALTVESRLGGGSVFRLETPLMEAEAAQDAAPQALEADEIDPQGVHILLAEDHEVNQRIVRLILEPLGFRLTVVADGAAAVEACGREAFDLILMDMQMPVMGGIEATTAIRARPGPNRGAPIIALTANALSEHRAQWAAVGVEVFMTKPIDMAALVENVSRAAAGHGRVEAVALSA